MQTMRGEEYQPPFHERQHALFELHFRFDVQMRRRLVEQPDAAFGVEQGARKGDALRLPA